MITSFFILALKILAVVAILVAMVVILTGIGHLTRREGTSQMKNASELRKEITESNRVISTNSVFFSFLGRNQLK